MSFSRMPAFIFFILAFLVFLPGNTRAQPAGFIPKKARVKKTTGLDSNGWKRSGFFVLNVNQAAQSDWSGGGENFQIGINAILNKAVHHVNGKYTFDTYLDFELGLVEASSFKQFRKTTDRLDLTFEAEHRIGEKGHFNYGLLGNVNTQVFGGHNYAVEGSPKTSGFLSPGKFLLSFGIDYKYTRGDTYFSLFISPATVRWITKLDGDFYNSYKFGVDSFQKVYTEMGAYLSVHFNTRFSKTAAIISRIDLFSNYKRDPQNVDLLLNNVLTFNMGKSFAATFLLDVLYDHDVKKRVQVLEVMGIGLRLRL